MPLLEAIGEEFALQASIDRVVAALAAHTSEE
jgi:hypothetical protein